MIPVCDHPEHADYKGKPWRDRAGMDRLCWLYWNFEGAKAKADAKPWRPPRDKQTGAILVQPGPGMHLKTLLAQMGLKPSAGCQCGKRQAQMDSWGVAGCREHRAEIVGWLKDEAAKAKWGEWYTAAQAARKQAWFRYADPYGSIVDEAIRRAEAKEQT